MFIISSVSYEKDYIPIGLAFLDSISRIFFFLPKLNNIIISQSLVSLRDRIYAGLIGTYLYNLNNLNLNPYLFK